MIRKFLYIMVILLAMSNIAFGADVSSGSSTSISYTVDNDYQSDDNYFRCQKLNNNKYITQIVGYDLLNGITYCSIVPKSKDSHIPRSQNANHRSTLASYEAYRNKQTISGAISSIAQAFGVETDVGTVSEITHKDGGTLSAFLTNLRNYVANIQDFLADFS